MVFCVKAPKGELDDTCAVNEQVIPPGLLFAVFQLLLDHLRLFLHDRDQIDPRFCAHIEDVCNFQQVHLAHIHADVLTLVDDGIALEGDLILIASRVG